MNDVRQAGPPRAWHEGPVDGILAAMECSEQGLTTAEAGARLLRDGPNALPRPKRPGVLLIFARQFKNPLVYLLLAATLVSLLVGALLDAFFILVVLLFNALIGAVQEWQAQRSAAALDQLVPHRAVVRRDGDWIEIDAPDLVAGDLVKLESGLKVSADLRLLTGQELTLDESLLTGESAAVAKNPNDGLDRALSVAERSNLLYAGTTVLAGRGTGLVVATAERTEIGKIAEILALSRGTEPPLVRQLARFSRLLGIATMVLIILIGVAQALQGIPLATVFLVAIALAVAAIPEGLPVAIAIALAIATRRMQRRRVIVRALPAVEGLGACNLIASDKTGTLTCNELTVKVAEPFVEGHPTRAVDVGGGGYRLEGAVTVDGRAPRDTTLTALEAMATSAALCNEATLRVTRDGVEHLGDTVDAAFLVFAAKLGLDLASLRDPASLVASIPYEPERRYAAIFRREKTSMSPELAEAHVKGAAEVLIPMCDGLAEPRRIVEEAERLAADGFRVLAVARGSVARSALTERPEDALKDLQFLGLVGLADPVRPEVPAAVERCRNAGISVRMITGDHPKTALAIARQLGIADRSDEVATQEELQLLAERREAFDDFVETKSVFARVEPVQKLDIVQALQRRGHVVAVTGDGVNDAPALKTADIGVAMGLSGTDAARGAADLILTDDNFASIVAGVEEGRIAYDNIRKLVYLLVTTGLGEIVLFILAVAFNLPTPLFAVQLLWLNLVTNGIQHIALALEKGEAGIETRKPRPAGEPIFNGRMIGQVCVAGTYMGVISFVAFDWFLDQGMAVSEARNLVLLLMVFFENAHVLNARSERQSILRIPLSANWFLVAAVIGAQGLHIAAMFVPGLSDVLRIQPIALFDWVMIAALAASLVLVMELYKRLTLPRADT